MQAAGDLIAVSSSRGPRIALLRAPHAGGLEEEGPSPAAGAQLPGRAAAAAAGASRGALPSSGAVRTPASGPPHGAGVLSSVGELKLLPVLQGAGAGVWGHRRAARMGVSSLTMQEEQGRLLAGMGSMLCVCNLET